MCVCLQTLHIYMIMCVRVCVHEQWSAHTMYTWAVGTCVQPVAAGGQQRPKSKRAVVRVCVCVCVCVCVRYPSDSLCTVQ